MAGTVKLSISKMQRHFPPLNFITIHYLYFTITSLISSVVFWGASTPPRSVSYIDSVFLVVSAMTEAGLNTVNLSEINTFQQFILFFHIIIGSAIFVSAFVVLFRKHAFEQRFHNIIKAEKDKVQRRRHEGERAGSHRPRQVQTTSPQAVDNTLTTPVDRQKDNESITTTVKVPEGQIEPSRPAFPQSDGHRTFDEETLCSCKGTQSRPRHRIMEFKGVGASSSQVSFHRVSVSGISISRQTCPSQDASARKRKSTDVPSHDLDFLEDTTVGRNAQFHGLTRDQREKLGGYEYRAISLLSWIVPLYFGLWQILGCIGLGAYIATNRPSTALENGINPWWLGIFNGVSAFNNSGMSLLDANMIPFQTSTYTLLTMALLILAGNTAYPLFLRLILWTAYRLLPETDYFATTKETFAFMLRYPRRVYTNLFPSAPTWWLLLSLVLLNGIDWAAFELLNIGNTATGLIPENYRILDGLFQACAVRSGGFYVVPISKVRIGLQVLYVLMMYISAYPVVITMRTSNVYEERSLGIFSDDPACAGSGEMGLIKYLKGRAMGGWLGHENSYFLQQQLRNQLAHDLWWLMLSILIIVCIETSQIERDPVTYSVFNVAFEVVSAYGCVGISVGLPDQAYSFSGGWHTASKLVLCAVMLRGRHRGLPVTIDRAVNLPCEDLGEREEEDWQIRLEGSRTKTEADLV